jgi:hypothetical protein
MYLIKSLSEKDFETDAPLYWCNTWGWVDRTSATRFSKEEVEAAMLIGKWEPEEAVE